MNKSSWTVVDRYLVTAQEVGLPNEGQRLVAWLGRDPEDALKQSAGGIADESEGRLFLLLAGLDGGAGDFLGSAAGVGTVAAENFAIDDGRA